SSPPATCRRRSCRWSPRKRSARRASSAASGPGGNPCSAWRDDTPGRSPEPPARPKPPVMTGRLLTLEGGEGVGKSTQRKALAEALRARGLQVVETREPGGSPGAEAIRALLLQGEVERWTAEAEALLFAAARSDHVGRTIRPALDRG